MTNRYGNDTLEIVVSTSGDNQLPYLHVYRADCVDLGRAVLSSSSGPPVIGDLNDDGQPEMIVSAGSNIYVFDRFLQPINVIPGGHEEIVLADVDFAGPVEIIAWWGPPLMPLWDLTQEPFCWA